MVEINPLVVTEAGEVVALDAKVSFDDNALYRQPGPREALRDESGGGPEGAGGQPSISLNLHRTSTAPSAAW